MYIGLLSSYPQRIVYLLLKRSKAEAEKRMWKEALNDANEVSPKSLACLRCSVNALRTAGDPIGSHVSLGL